eukprot:8516270-Alexandrium_andersonii.AAC.1
MARSSAWLAPSADATGPGGALGGGNGGGGADDPDSCSRRSVMRANTFACSRSRSRSARAKTSISRSSDRPAEGAAPEPPAGGDASPSG